MSNGFKINSTQHPCVRSTEKSFGYDLRSAEGFLLHRNETRVVSTGVFLEMDDDVMAMVCSRSGLSVCGIVVANAPGIIDADYKNEVKVILHNLGPKEMAFSNGDKVAQLVFVKALRGDDIASEQRTGGLGSTGK